MMDLGDGQVLRDDEGAVGLDEQPDGEVLRDAAPDVTLVEMDAATTAVVSPPDVALFEQPTEIEQVIREEPVLLTEVVLGVPGAEGPEGPSGPEGAPGPPGPAGADGSGDATYTHHQMSPAELWIIDHPLNKYPSVSVEDSAGTAVYGDLTIVNMTRVTVRFDAAFSGRAHLN